MPSYALTESLFTILFQTLLLESTTIHCNPYFYTFEMIPDPDDWTFSNHRVRQFFTNYMDCQQKCRIFRRFVVEF